MRPSTRALAAIVLLFTLSGFAQGVPLDKGQWRAAGKTARGVTGDVAFGGERIAINFSAFPIAQIRTATPAEVQATFDLPDAPASGGNLYRLSIPGETKFVHKNTLCGSEETQWMLTYTAGKQLQIAFFSGDKMPQLTTEALANGSNLCGTYSYVR